MKIKIVLLGAGFGLLLLLFSCSEDENEPPMADDLLFIVAEDVPIGTVVGTVSATDKEGDALTYTITAGNDANEFELSDEGTLRTLALLDYETATSYQLAVRIADNSGSIDILITINVTDVDEGTGVIGGTVTVDGITYSLVDGLIEDYGGDGTHYNYDFVLVDDAIAMENDEPVPGEGTKIGVYAELFSAGDASFDVGTFEYLDEAVSPGFTQSYFNYLTITTFDDPIGDDPDPDADGYFIAVGGSVTVVENAELNYTLTYNIDLAEADFDTDELINGGDEFSLTFAYTGDFVFVPLDETARTVEIEKSNKRIF